MSCKIFDIHTHAWPEKVAPQARAHLESLFNVHFVGEPTVETLLAYMDANNIAASAVCAVATKPEQVPSINNWLFEVTNSRIKVMCALHPAFEGCLAEIERIKKYGHGIKMQPEFQDFYVDDEAVFPLYERIEQLKLPLLFHCGQELSGTMKVHSSPERIRKIKRIFPRLKLIAAHFGGFRMWEEVARHLIGEDIYLDTAFFFDYLPPDQIRRMLLAHRPDRIVFGTDFPLIDQKKDIDFIRNLDIPPALKEGILWNNASPLFSELA